MVRHAQYWTFTDGDGIIVNWADSNKYWFYTADPSYATTNLH